MHRSVACEPQTLPNKPFVQVTNSAQKITR